MTDIETLLERLRSAAVDHAAPDTPVQVPVRRWSTGTDAGARRAIMDGWASIRPWNFRHFLVPGSDDFVEFAFLACVGRPADPVARGHYLGRLQQGMPRLEVLAQLGGSPECVKFRGEPPWPLWLRPALWALRVPTDLGRRVVRGVLRRIEGRLGKRVRAGAVGDLWRVAGAFDDRDSVRQGEWDAFARQVDATTETLSSVADGNFATLASRLAAANEASSQAMAVLRARLAALEHPLPGTAVATAAPAADDDVTRYYVTLESVFRGDPARIRAQLRDDYLDILVKALQEAGEGPCIDLGCGRGEWLDVLRDRGFEARGVEMNPAMASVAQASGHDVILGDALAYLCALPGDSVSAISAFHLAEHLDFPTLFRLIAECRRVLKPRGLLMLETPNPENIWVATHTFHHDPTHGNPLTPTSLEFLVNHHGLETVAILRLHPYPENSRLPGHDPVSERLNAMTCGSQDFAVVAKKTPLA